jgi:hypothetical protein
MRRNGVVIAIVLGLVVGAGAVVVIAATGGSSTKVSSRLPKLPAGAYGARDSAAAAMAMPAYGQVEWRVQGTLPSLPDHATAYRVEPTPTDAAVARMATAFGLAGRPQRQGAGWTLTDGERHFVVVNGTWTLATGADCLPPIDAPADMSVSCASSSAAVATSACVPDTGCTIPEPNKPAGLPSEAQARTVAVRALEAAGLDTSGHVQVTDAFSTIDVTADPAIGGARVVGTGNQLSVGPGQTLVRGSGTMGTTAKVGEYPLVTTEKGLERLRAPGGPVPALGRPEPAIAIAPAPGGPGAGPLVRTITDVTLGLQRVDQYLTPVFLFHVDGGDVLPVPAVVDALLTPVVPPEPTPAPFPPGRPGQAPPAPPARPVPPTSGNGGANSGGSSQACSGQAVATSDANQDNQALKLEACVSPTTVRVGEPVTFSLTVVDPDAAIDDMCDQPSVAFGDEGGVAHCMAACVKESFPPEATKKARTFTHAYKQPGTYTAIASAGSCAPKGGHAQVELQITVRA